MNEVKVLFFATLKEYVGAKSLQMELPAGATIGELKNRLIDDYPRLAKMRESIMAAVNREYAADDLQIPAHAEVALFPPVSGG